MAISAPTRNQDGSLVQDQAFDATECLFLWFEKLHVGTGMVMVEPTEIDCPDQSTNRSKYCTAPEDVLPPALQDCGIAMVIVADVPEMASSGDGTRIYFAPVHDPLEDNYSHTEIRAFREVTRQTRLGRINSKSAKLGFRTSLCRKLTILRSPMRS
jgi:hypothetical protein